MAAILEKWREILKNEIHIFHGNKKVGEVPHLKFSVNLIVSKIPMVAQLSCSPCIYICLSIWLPHKNDLFGCHLLTLSMYLYFCILYDTNTLQKHYQSFRSLLHFLLWLSIVVLFGGSTKRAIWRTVYAQCYKAATRCM